LNTKRSDENLNFSAWPKNENSAAFLDGSHDEYIKQLSMKAE